MPNEKKSKSTRVDTIAKEKSTIKSLRQQNKKLRAEVRKLKSDLATLNAAFRETQKFLKGTTEELAVERLIDAAKSNKSLKNIRLDEVEAKACPKCSAELTFIPGRNFTLRLCKACGYRDQIQEEQNGN